LEVVHIYHRVQIFNDKFDVKNISNLNLSLITQSEIFQFFLEHGAQLFIWTLIAGLIMKTVSFLLKHLVAASEQDIEHSNLKDLFSEVSVFSWSTIIVCTASFLATVLISAISGNNYFSHENYPWGDLLLIVFIISSKYLFMFVSNSDDDYIRSKLVENSYRVTISQSTLNVETGLKLNEIALQVRPLPTEGDPEWFLDSYRMLFDKYYGVKEIPVFH
jgi:hypothetical protein